MRAFAVFFALLLATPAAATSLELAPLTDVARGRYGYEETTTSWANLLTATLREGPFALEATSGHLHVEGPAAAGAQGGVGGENPFARRRTGLADTTIGASWRDVVGERFWLQTGVELKVPTADAARGLGTGAVDGTVRLRAAWLGWAVTPFVDGSWTLLGDGTDGIRTRTEAWSIGVGGAMRFDAGFSAGLFGELRQPVVPDAQPVRSLLLFGEVPLNDALTLSGWVGVGTGALAVKQRAGLRLAWRILS
jgi:hypothetical protein